MILKCKIRQVPTIIVIKVKVKSSMARSFPVENLLPQNVGSIINYLQYTKLAQWGTPSCSQPQPATDNGVRDGRSNWLVAPTASWAVPPERLVHSINQCTQLDSNVQPQHVRQPPCLCGHSGYESFHLQGKEMFQIN